MIPMIKICGMTQPDNIKAVLMLKPDFMGFIFYPHSPRCITGKVNPGFIQGIASSVITTGVFVNESLEMIFQTAKTYGLRAIQLHGSETPEDCQTLRSEGLTVIKAFGIKTAADLLQTERYAACTDYFLFDTQSQNHGGTGQSFDWSVLKTLPLTKPWFLGGGISPANICEAAATGYHALDLNSRFETKPGIKDIYSLKEAIKLIRKQ